MFPPGDVGQDAAMSAVKNLLSRPGAKPLLAAGIVGRLPMGMVGLGVTLLVVGSTGSYALAGALSATTTLAVALVSPYGARFADRSGQRRAIPVLLAVNVASMLLLTASVSLQWPVALWFGFAALAGASTPGLGAMTRARWIGIARDGQERSTAFAIESVADELAFVVGPVLASALALAFIPAAPVLFGLLMAVIGGLALAAQRRTEPLPGRHRADQMSKVATGHVLQFAGIAALWVVLMALGAMFGSLNVSTVAYAESVNPALTGILLGALSFGSLVSGVVLGVTRRRWSLVTQVRISIITLALALAPLAFIGLPGVYAVVSFVAGLSVSTTMIGVFGLIERMVPNARITEAIAFVGSGLALGMAGGVWAAGWIIDTFGPSLSLGLAAVFATLAAAMFWGHSFRIARVEAAADANERARADQAEQAESVESAVELPRAALV
jgi:MFS family permease